MPELARRRCLVLNVDILIRICSFKPIWCVMVIGRVALFNVIDAVVIVLEMKRKKEEKGCINSNTVYFC